MHINTDLNSKLDSFLRDCQKQAYGIANLAIKNSADSLDVIQNTMIAFVKYYPSKPEDQWRALFYKVLQNKINDHFRSKKRWFNLFTSPKDQGSEISEVLMVNNQESKNTTPTQYFQSDEINKNISQAISMLPERQRQAVIYRLWQGFSVKETAHIMKVTQGSIKTHLSRALSNLKGQLGETYE